MDLFYRDFDSKDRIRSGAKHLGAAAARIAASVVMGMPQLPDAVWGDFKRLLTVDALWGLCIVLAGWVIATLIGGLVGLAVNGLLLAYGVVELWDTLKGVAASSRQWLTTAYHATTSRELAAAGTHFAAALGSGGLTLAEIIVTHRIFRAIEGRLRRAIPTPDWLQRRYEEAVLERDRASRRLRPDEPSTWKQMVRKTVDASGGLRGPGARRAASSFPTEAVVVTGLLLGVAAVGGVALAVSGTTRRSR